MLVLLSPCSIPLGNLALSRALGDFVFKRNDTKKPEEQIVTGKARIKTPIRGGRGERGS